LAVSSLQRSSTTGRDGHSDSAKEILLDIQIIVAELKSERDRIEQVIGLLEQNTIIKTRVGRLQASGPAKPRRGGITPAGRRKLSAAMKKRWAQKRSSTNSSPIMAAARTPRKRGGLTATGRKKLSEAMKKRWAEKQREAS